MIEIRNLSKKYETKYAVKDLSFNVKKGKIYGLLGANGAGKSTTMNMITGYLSPTSGQIIIDGYDMQKDPIKAKKRIGYLPEIPPLYNDMTVVEYLMFAGELKKVEKKLIKDTVEKLLEKTGLTEVRDRLIKNLSKGYKQRVGLAQALIGDPEIVILDEPTVGLDPVQIVEIRKLIEGLKEKHTVILSSHILSEIESVCDQIIIISKGCLVAMDTPQNLSKNSHRKNSTYLKIKGNKTALGNMLHDISEIESFEFLDDNAVTIYSDDDICEKLFYACIKADLPILQMKSEVASLEDVFIELTQNEEEIHESENASIDVDKIETDDTVVDIDNKETDDASADVDSKETDELSLDNAEDDRKEESKDDSNL